MTRWHSLSGLLRGVALAAALCVPAALALGAPAAAQATPDGVNVAGFFGTPAQNAQIESEIDQLHPAWVRVFVNWSAIEPTAGNIDLGQIADYKSLFASLPAGTKVDVDVVLTPSWASGSTNPAAPPSDDQSYAGFVNYLANAFGSSVNAWEIWNEEDSSGWWTGSTAQYASLLKAAYPAIKAADPSAQVVLGANDPAYLQTLYADGAGHSFDAVAVHTDRACDVASPYDFSYDPGTQNLSDFTFLGGFTSMRSVMVANGDASKPILITELGWSTTNSECEEGASAGKKLSGVSDATQATYLQQAYHCLAQPQYSYVTAAIWFEMVDFGTAANFNDHYGLLTASLAPKPSFAAFEQESRNGDQLTGTCGNFAGPQVTLMDPRQGERYSGKLLIKVRAIGAGRPVVQIKLKHDTKTVLNFNRHDADQAGNTLSASFDWEGAPKLPLGTHTISVIATYANGVTTTVSVTVDHVKAHKHHQHH